MKNKIYNYLMNNDIIVEKDVFEYGFDFFLSYLIYLLIIIPISILTDSFFEIILFIILYIPIRKNIGGFHLKNPYHCIILSSIVTLLIPYIQDYIPISYYFAISIIVLNFILYIMFIPVDCKEKQLSDIEKKSYKLLSLKIHALYSFFILFFCATNMQLMFHVVCIIELVSTFSISLSIIKKHYF